MTTPAPKNKRPDGGATGRLWRTEHFVEIDVSSGDEGHGWAVSYSDLLMVLMSFFIIFFSYDEEKPQNLLEEISIGLTSIGGQAKYRGQNDAGENKGPGKGPGQGEGKGAGQGAGLGPGQGGQQAAAGQGSGSGTGQGAGNAPINIKDLGSALNAALASSSVAVDMETTPTTIKVSFKEDLYATREWRLQASAKRKLDLVLDYMLSKKDQITIEVVGQTDSRAVHAAPGDIVTNNFILSSLRASSALDYLLAKGFPSDSLSATGIASAGEGGRTLSLKFSAKTQPAVKASQEIAPGAGSNAPNQSK